MQLFLGDCRSFNQKSFLAPVGREQSSSAGPPESPAQTGEMYPTPHNTPEGLSNPPSVPSTPRSVYHPTVRATANQPGDSPTATPRSQISEEDQKSGMDKPPTSIVTLLALQPALAVSQADLSYEQNWLIRNYNQILDRGGRTAKLIHVCTAPRGRT